MSVFCFIHGWKHQHRGRDLRSLARSLHSVSFKLIVDSENNLLETSPALKCCVEKDETLRSCLSVNGGVNICYERLVLKSQTWSRRLSWIKIRNSILTQYLLQTVGMNVLTLTFCKINHVILLFFFCCI